MPKEKVDRKRLLKEPDEFISTSVRAMRWLRRNSRWVSAGAVLAVVCAVAVWGWKVYQDRREAQAQELQAQAYSLYARAVEEAEKTASQDLMGKAVERFETVIKQFPDTRTGWIARVYRGRANYALGKYDEAVQDFETALGSVPSGDDGTLRALALQGLGLALQAKGNWEKAASVFQSLKQAAAGSLGRMADLELARCYEKQGKTKEALSVYQSLLGLLSEPLQREMVQAQIARLSQSLKE